jgi:hypothetical protein
MNVYGLVLSISLIAISFLMLNIRHKRQVLWMISIVMLVYKIIEYIVYFISGELTKLPIEYSALGYFIFSVVVVFKINKLYGFAGFVACLSGFGYLIAFPFMGDGSFINHGIYLTIAALVNHLFLFMGSLFLMTLYEYQKSDLKIIMNYTVFYVIYVLIASYFISFDQTHFIVVLLDLNERVPGKVISFLQLFNIVVLFVLYYWVIKIYALLNQKIYKKYHLIDYEENI